MHALWFIFGGLAGLCAFSFLLAGILGFYDLVRPSQKSTGSEWLLHFFSGGWSTFFRGIFRHWRLQADLRRLFYYAAISVGVMVALLYIGSRT